MAKFARPHRDREPMCPSRAVRPPRIVGVAVEDGVVEVEDEVSGPPAQLAELVARQEPSIPTPEGRPDLDGVGHGRDVVNPDHIGPPRDRRDLERDARAGQGRLERPNPVPTTDVVG